VALAAWCGGRPRPGQSGRCDARVATDVPRRSEVVVVGSGICGAAAAASLASRGLKVLLVDKEQHAAAEASGQAQGVLRLQGRDPLEVPLAREALALWREASAEGAQFEIVFGGNMYLAQDTRELDELRVLVGQAHAAGLQDVVVLDPAETRALVPAARGAFAGAMWSPHDGHCDPRAATEHFLGCARRAGAEVAFGAKARRILMRGSRVVGVEIGAEMIRCEHVVVAAGVWTPHLVSTVGVRVPIMPVSLTEAETSPAPALFRTAVRAYGFGGRQRPSGRIVLSAGLNARVRHGLSLYDTLRLRAWTRRLLAHRGNVSLYVDWNAVRSQVRHRSLLDPDLVPVDLRPPPNVAEVETAHRAMSRIFPDVASTRVERLWSGWIDMSLDGLPIIDGQTGPSGLVFVTGLSGHGLTLGPVIGEIAADLVSDGTTTREIHPFRLSRFREQPVGVPRKTI
jgi:sarcosine oxidase subunit beta